MKVFAFISIFLVASCNSANTTFQKITPSSVTTLSCHSTSENSLTTSVDNGDFEAKEIVSAVLIDGCGNDETWATSPWHDMNYKWMGSAIDSADYHGRFKLAWDSQNLYVLVEVVDDYLHPTLRDGKENYWKGDYVEVFIDEDKSGGSHTFNHQAFAYHVSTEGHVIDKNTLKKTVFFDDHIEVKRTQEGNRYLWEMAIKLFDKNFDESTTTNTPVSIVENKRIGFSIAYGDNDGNNSRENFMGSKKTHGVNNDAGYINSDVFGSILFVE